MTKLQEMVQENAIDIIVQYGEFRKHRCFIQGMLDYQAGILGDDNRIGYAAQCYDRGQECQMRINRMMEAARSRLL